MHACNPLYARVRVCREKRAYIAAGKEGHGENGHFKLNRAAEKDGAHGLRLHLGVAVL